MAVIAYDIIITGDLNFHVDIKSDVQAHRFYSILNSHGLTQHVNGATHKGDHIHILNLVMFR